MIEEGPYCTLMRVQGYIEMEGLLHNARESSSLTQCRPDVFLVYRKSSELELLPLLFNYRQL